MCLHRPTPFMVRLYLWTDPFASLWFPMPLSRMLKPSCLWNTIATLMGTSCAEINPHLIMCADGSRGAMNVKGAFSESSNLASPPMWTFPLKHTRFVPSHFTRMLLLCFEPHLARYYAGVFWCLINKNNSPITLVTFIKCHGDTFMIWEI